MASVLLLLPDELLADIDATRDGPRLEWIREALRLRLTIAHNQAESRTAVSAAQALHGRAIAARPVRHDGPGRAARTVTRQGTLPGGDMCAHPFRDDQGMCRICGQR